MKRLIIDLIIWLVATFTCLVLSQEVLLVGAWHDMLLLVAGLCLAAATFAIILLNKTATQKHAKVDATDSPADR